MRGEDEKRDEIKDVGSEDEKKVENKDVGSENEKNDEKENVGMRRMRRLRGRSCHPIVGRF